MPISLRAAALRTDLERVLDGPVHLLAVDGRTRIHAEVPPDSDIKRWTAILAILLSADRWGSQKTNGAPAEIWAEVKDEETL